MRQPHIIFLLGQYHIVSKIKDTIDSELERRKTYQGAKFNYLGGSAVTKKGY